MSHILFGSPREQAEIGATQSFSTPDQLKSESRQDPADSQTQAADFFDKPVGTHRVFQKRFDEFEKDPDIRRSSYRLAHAPYHEGLVTLNVDLDQINGQVFGEQTVDRDHIELDRTFCRAPLTGVGH